MTRPPRQLEPPRKPRRTVLAAVLAGGLVGNFCAACGSGKPPAASYNRVLTPEEARRKNLLTDEDRARVSADLRALAAGHEVVARPRPAPGPAFVRWEDVPAAVAAACNEKGVEMAVVRTEASDDRLRFVLRTIEDWPGELVVRRAYGDEVYEVEHVEIGRFPDRPERVERGQLLVDSFREHLLRLGRQARY